MSLLLDALRRADRERQQGKPPSLSQVTGRMREDRPARPGLLIVPLLLGALGGAGYYFWSAGYVQFLPAPGAPPAPATPATPQTQVTQMPPPPELRGVDVVTLDDVLEPPAAPAKPAPRQEAPAPAARTTPTPPTEAMRPAPPEPVKAPSGSEEVVAVEPSPVQPSTREEPALRLLREMPPAYRADFPDLRIDVHVYLRQQARRFVLVNGRRYKEGERLAEGPQLVAIVPNGVVLDYRGERVLFPVIR